MHQFLNFFIVFYVALCTSPTVPRYHGSIIISVFSSLFFVFGVSQAHGLIWTGVMEFVCVWSTSFPEGLTRVTHHRPAVRATTKALLLCSCLVYVCMCLSLNETCYQIRMNKGKTPWWRASLQIKAVVSKRNIWEWMKSNKYWVIQWVCLLINDEQMWIHTLCVQELSNNTQRNHKI